MGKHNRFEVAEAVGELLKKMEKAKKNAVWGTVRVPIKDVCEDLSIFDWWNDYLSISQLKQMRNFLSVAELLGYNGYVCFKVGAAGCSHGMWAHKAESTDGYSPKGECLFHSFRSGENYYDALLADGTWMHRKYNKDGFTLKEVRAELEA